MHAWLEGRHWSLYLNQTKDERSMAQFRPWIGDKSSQTLREIQRGRYMSRKEEQRVRWHLAHLGASGLLIGRDTELGSIHHRPLRPIDNFDDSRPVLFPWNWTHPLSLKVSPLAWDQACWRCWVKGRGADMEKTRAVVSFKPRQMWDSRANRGKTICSARHNTIGEHFGRQQRQKCHNVIVSIYFLGKPVLEKLHYSW